MRLYHAPRHSYIQVKDPNPKIPVAAPDIQTDEILYFDHVDGMYSFCRNDKGNIVHLIAWAEVEVVDNPENWLDYFPQE